MKQNVKTFSKRNKIIAIIVAILLACCITVSGIMLFRGQKSAPVNAASPNTTVTIVTKDKDGNPTTEFEPGDTVYFTVTIDTTRTSLNWFSISCIISPVKNGKTDTDLLKYLSIPADYSFKDGDDYNYMYDNFVKRNGYYSAELGTDTIDSLGIIFGLYCADPDHPVGCDKAVEYSFPVVISSDYEGEMSFGVQASANNQAQYMTGGNVGTASANTDDLEKGTMACTPVKLTIGDGGGGGGDKDNDTSIDPSATQGGKGVTLTSTGGTGFKGSVGDLNGKVTINVNPKSPTTTVTSGGGDIDLSKVPTNADGSKTVSVSVKAEDGSTETYTFTFTKSESSAFNISVTASGGSSPQTWTTPGSHTYTVPYDTTSVTLTASATSPITVASGSQTGTKTNLAVGNNGPYKIWGVAEDGTNSTGDTAFNITIVRQKQPANDTFEMTVTATATGVTPGSWSTPGNYTYTVPYDTTSVDLSALAQSPATVAAGSATGTKTDLQVGNNGPYKIWAVAQDNTNSDGAAAFYITIVRRPEAVDAPLLSDIRISEEDDGNDYSVNNFDPEKFGVYKVYVSSNTTHPRVTAFAADPTAQITMKVNGVTKDVNTGKATDVPALLEIGSSTTVEITVSLDGKSSTYTLTIIRSSETPYLTYLTVGTYQIFDANGKAVNGKDENAVRDVYDFYVTIENADRNVNIFARASEEDLDVKIASDTYAGQIGIGECNVNPSVDALFGMTAHADVQITIYPRFGKTVVHNIHLTRKPALSNNTNAGITIGEITKEYNEKMGYDLSIFNKEYADNNFKLIYGKPYHVPYNAGVLTITVKVDDLGELVAPATYEILYNDVVQRDANGKVYENVHLNYDCNVVTINIIASDGTQRPVTVHVERDLPYLFSANINEIREFAEEYKADCTSYTYEVSHDVTKLTISVGCDPMYNYVISGADNLKNGLNIVTICLYEKNTGIAKTAAATNIGDAVRTITIDVFRDSNGNISTIWLILFIIFLLLAIIEAIIVAVLMMRRRNDDTTTHHVVVASAPAPVPVPAPAPVVRIPPQVQYVPMPQPQVQYVQVPQPQPVDAEKPQQPVNVEVKITGCGDSDGYYKTKK